MTQLVKQPTAAPTRKWWYFAVAGAAAGAVQGAIGGACEGGLAVACSVPDVSGMVQSWISLAIGGIAAYVARERA